MNDLPIGGLYRHYKGGLYLVLGVGHDANADTLRELNEPGAYEHCSALGEREVVVYVALDASKPGPPLSVRTRSDFEAAVCGEPTCEHYGSDRCVQPHAVERFAYVGQSR